MKILGIDYGEKRIGFALSDELGKFAFEYRVIDNWRYEELIDELRQLIILECIEKIVVGLPKNMSGEDTEKTQEVRDFAATLQNCLDIEIVFEDERLTTKMVDKVLRSMNISQKQARGKKDMVAAKYILQSYLDRENLEI